MTTLNQRLKTFNQHRAVESALNNELKTRDRVDRLERRATDVERVAASILAEIHGLARRDFLGRCRWLFLGR